jgi:[protein-PII] uridylyltransferase
MVEVLNTSSQATIVEVRAHDAPGLLYRAAAAVTQTGATIVGAKVSTLGADAVDVFFITDVDGRQLTSKACDLLRMHVVEALGSPAGYADARVRFPL